MATVKITKNGMEKGSQMYAVRVTNNGNTFKVHTWCNRKAANAISKNVTKLLASFEGKV